MRPCLFGGAAVAALVLVFTGGASAHRSGCHSAHSCPSDHHSYVWYDAAGRGWDCAEPGAAEVEPADTARVSYDGRAYLCHAAGAAPAAPSSATLGTRTKVRGCRAEGLLPDPACSPGAVFPGAGPRQICVAGYSSRVRNVPESVKLRVYAEYGIASHRRGQYEVDHLVSLELGGSNEIANLWPEAAPGFRDKDRLENALHAAVCSGRIALATAQRGIARDWPALARLYG